LWFCILFDKNKLLTGISWERRLVRLNGEFFGT